MKTLQNLLSQSKTVYIMCLLTGVLCTTASGGTKELTFGWEDETSTVFGEFISGTNASVEYANVSIGSEVDYGPSDAPFDTPLIYEVVPSEGERMLLVDTLVDDERSNAVSPFLAYVENLDDEDTVQFSFDVFDPSEGRSPSVLPSGTYGFNGDFNSFAGFFTPFQVFPPGTGWLNVVADAEPDEVTFPAVNPDLFFDAGDEGDRTAVVMRATVFRPSSSTIPNGGSGEYKFFIDNLRIQVTSDNPLAQITLPDGSVTLVNSDDPFDPLDLNEDGVVNAEDAAFICSEGKQLDVLPGDADLNGTVEFSDFLTLSGNFGQAGHYGDGDFDCSGSVDFSDFLTLSSNFGKSAAAVAAVPEPSAGLLLIVAATGLLGVRRRR